MTIGCENSKRASRSQHYFYSPYEYGVVGGTLDTRAAFAHALAKAIGNAYVVEESAAVDPYLAPQAAIDADVVLVPSAKLIEMPLLAASDCHEADAIAHWSADGSFGEDEVEHAAQCVRDHVTPAPLKGLVLVGGKSTRMGEDKSTIDYHGAPQYVHTAKLLGDACEEVFISARPDQSSEFGDAGTITDRFLGMGPFGAIMSALIEDPDAAWLVCACDLPYLDKETIDHLVSQRNHLKLATAFRSSYQDFPEPLCTIYEPKSVHRMARFMTLGYHCPRKVLINSDTNVIDPLRATALDNVNTQEERAAAIDRLGADTKVES